jgi:hypothetical protein
VRLPRTARLASKPMYMLLVFTPMLKKATK